MSRQKDAISHRYYRRRLLQVSGGLVSLASLGIGSMALGQEDGKLFTQIVTHRLLPGKEAEGISLGKEMIAASMNQTPELQMNFLCRGVDDPMVVRTFEVFTSREAAMTNGGSPALMRLYPRLSDVYQQGNDFLRLERISGYSRMPPGIDETSKPVRITRYHVRSGQRAAAIQLAVDLVARHEEESQDLLVCIFHQEVNNPEGIVSFELFDNSDSDKTFESAFRITEFQARLQAVFDQQDTGEMLLLHGYTGHQ